MCEAKMMQMLSLPSKDLIIFLVKER